MKEIPSKSDKNKNFRNGTKWHFSAHFGPFKNVKIYKKMLGICFVAFLQEIIYKKDILIQWEIKKFRPKKRFSVVVTFTSNSIGFF